jgi:hypothetical protein
MKKETEVYTVLTHEEALKKRGFVKYIQEKNYFNWVYEMAIPKSIYDKKMMKITKYVLEAEYKIWSVKDTNHIQKIINGDFDEKRN